VKCPVDRCPVVAAALITAHATTHSASGAGAVAARVEKMRRPNVSFAGTSGDWQYFTSRWGDYVSATKLTGTDRVVQLLEYCDEQLRKDLTRTAGGTLTGMMEAQVLAAIKSLAVREENAMVARVALHNMRQDRDESVRAFGARLRGQAGVCKFVIGCTACRAEINYTAAILLDVLCRELNDSDIQLDLLSDKNQDMTLEQVFRFVEAKEAGKRSTTRLLVPHGTDALMGSTYRSKKRESQVPHQKEQGTRTQSETCSYCGRKGHGKSAPSRVRRRECPAYG